MPEKLHMNKLGVLFAILQIICFFIYGVAVLYLLVLLVGGKL